MASNNLGESEVDGPSEAAGTKRSHSNRESTSQTDEDIAQIRKRVMEANNALRESGLAWSSEAGRAGVEEAEEEDAEEYTEEDEEEDSDEDEDEHAEEDESETDDDALPASPIAATSTHVWVLSLQQGDSYSDSNSEVRSVFRHFIDAVRTIIPEVRGYGFGEDEEDEMYFKDPTGFIDIADKHGDNYTWRFEDAEGSFISFDLKRMLIK